MALEQVLQRIDSDRDAALERLLALLRIPSISTDPAFAGDVDRAADWLVDDLRSLGASVEKHATPRHPMVTGQIGEGAPHLLFYGHYDVQPVDPLNLWTRDPFDPAVEDTPNGPVIRGRGTSDDKGQLMTFVEACRAWIAAHGALPCRISFLFEGEEEIGSPSLVPFMEGHREMLTADLALICDTGMFDPETPAITTMLRGLMGEELIIRGPDRDLHSGMYGGAARNPIQVLAKILAALHDETGRITVPGFYDGVTELPEEIRAQWEALGFDGEGYLGAVGLSEPAGEAGRSVLEQIWARPTCEINGISGGYTGEGFKTVLPAEARAKVSFRLVGTQDPHAIRKSFRAMVEGMLPPDCTVEFIGHSTGTASVMPTDDPAFEAARKALSDEWPREAAFAGSGGSIPIAGHFERILGMPSMLIGFSREDDGLHSPNEKYDLEAFQKGTRSWARVLAALSQG
ncbi:dipeptidase [Ovoidimarina sediminis]|uniref:dipeptidase n=1 Tax=Ovoidimarina sediminis TaxID=3079856 RepID=UPI002913A5DB|nr:dipeptidase [Rhodophyticola sp. MJ-SS7]MDU8942010.1 dipeptidase [Rhodophyticola sp. MJ-SS7]